MTRPLWHITGCWCIRILATCSLWLISNTHTLALCYYSVVTRSRNLCIGSYCSGFHIRFVFSCLKFESYIYSLICSTSRFFVTHRAFNNRVDYSNTVSYCLLQIRHEFLLSCGARNWFPRDLSCLSCTLEQYLRNPSYMMLHYYWIFINLGNNIINNLLENRLLKQHSNTIFST